jgi:hypothetical protein
MLSQILLLPLLLSFLPTSLSTPIEIEARSGSVCFTGIYKDLLFQDVNIMRTTGVA